MNVAGGAHWEAGLGRGRAEGWGSGGRGMPRSGEGGEDDGHGELVDELAVEEEALPAAPFHREAHALVEADGAGVVSHHGELEAVQAVRGGPVLRVPEQAGADATAGRVSADTDHHVGGAPAPAERAAGQLEV